MNALASLRDGTKSGKREQTILTPQWLLDHLLFEWGHIAMDPCAEAIDGLVPAAIHITKEMDGLRFDWPPYTYCNPPFGDLKKWLAHAKRWPGPTAVLTPVRCHRPWYREAERSCLAVIEFNAFGFRGFEQTFPAPLALMCWGWQPTAKVWDWRGDVRRIKC